MSKIRDAAAEFLASKRVAVTGVSRHPKNHGSNFVYQRLRERGYEVFAVNPNAETVEGDRSYRDLRSIPGGVDAVVIATRPELAEEAMRECADLGIKHAWMHRGPGGGSVSKAAATLGRARGIAVIDGGCPCMLLMCLDDLRPTVESHPCAELKMALYPTQPGRVPPALSDDERALL